MSEPCSCIAVINAKLAEHNTMLQVNYMSAADIFIETIKVDEKKRGRPIKIFATY